MQKLLLIGTRDWTAHRRALDEVGFETRAVTPDEAPLREVFDIFQPEGLLLEMVDDMMLLQHVRRLFRAELSTRPIPILALARRTHLSPPHLIVGVDDFLLPPYDSAELLARIRMLLWRYRRVDAHNCLRIGSLTIDLAGRIVTAAGRPVPLTPREYQLLRFLATHRQHAFTREALLTQVWGYDFEGDARVVDAYVQRVRRKLGPPHCDLLETVRSVGYRLSG